MREYRPPAGTVVIISPEPVEAKINGIPVTLHPYTQIAIHPSNVPAAFPTAPVADDTKEA
jgi:hypothetical protein